MANRPNNHQLFVRVPAELYRLDGLTMLDVNLLALVLGFGKKGLRLSNSRLAELFNIDRRSVVRAVKRLREKQYVRDAGQRQNRCLVATGDKLSLLDGVKRLPTGDKLSPDSDKKSPPLVTKSLKTGDKLSPIIEVTEDKLNIKEPSCPNTVAFGLAKLLLDLILERKPTFKKPNLQTWAKHVERMIRIDKRTLDVIERVIRWCQQDEFWQNNILSTEKLRQHFDQLELKQKTKGKKIENERSRTGRPKVPVEYVNLDVS